MRGRNYLPSQKKKMNKRANKYRHAIPAQRRLFAGVLLMSLFLAACSGTKHLPEGETLYTGADIVLESTQSVRERSIKKTVERAIRPQPNASYLGMRPRLWLYMVAGEDPSTRLGKWLKNTGEAPVYMGSVKPGVTANIIDASLFNIGIFNAYTESQVEEKKKTAKVIYTSHIHKPYTVSALEYDLPDDSLSYWVAAEKSNSLIKPGAAYNLEILENERLRIDDVLKDRGYFYFNPDYLLFMADTSMADQSITLTLTFKDSIPDNARTVYHLNRVYIDQDYSLNAEGAENTSDTTMVGGYVFAGSEMEIRPKVILRSVYLRENEIYSRRNHAITLNRLMSMGNFKFVQVKFSDSDTPARDLLDVEILMTAMQRRTLRAGMDIVSKSNNFAGPRLNISLINRNTFRGAEFLNLSLAGSFETQLGSQRNNLFSYSLNPQAELVFPRFIVPFNTGQRDNSYVPKTRILLSYQYLKRVEYFEMNTFQFMYGYKWKHNIRTEHDFNPINLSYTSITNPSATFQELLDSNPFLRKSYEEQFIAGGDYSFTFNEQVYPHKRTQYYVLSTLEAAGNAFSLVKTIAGDKPSSEDPSNVLGSAYAQYAKTSVDARGYYNFQGSDKLAFRLFAGVAKPYGNSDVLPYSKQFFSGGPNSIRAFQIHSVGPGTHYQESDNVSFLKLGGEIKLETNAEYRFTIYRFLKGALFLDAGNVWLLQSNNTNTGSPFKFSGFLSELAVGTGIGLRIDVSFFILRFDLGVPIRKPWLEDNHRWVLGDINFGSSTWRRENLVLNIAIGYPF
jgi:outer membrane protein insertion porin family